MNKTLLLFFLFITCTINLLWANKYSKSQIFICKDAKNTSGIGLDSNPSKYCYKWSSVSPDIVFSKDSDANPSLTILTPLFAPTTASVTVVDDNGNFVVEEIKIFVYELKLEIRQPKVMDANNALNLPSQTQPLKIAQTFVNIDNDDNDDFFYIDDKEVSGGDNELAPIKAYFRLLGGDYPTVAADGTANKGNIVPDNITLLFRAIGLAPQTVRLWQKASKEIPYANAFELSYKQNDFTKETIGSIDWLTANVWAEGVVAHTAPYQAQFELLVKDEDVSADGNCNRGNVSLTVAGVTSINWVGVGNGEVNSPTYTSNELCSAATGCRVFPDGRYSGTPTVLGTVSASKDIVNIKIILSTPMPNAFTLHVKSFDMDDPTQNKTDLKIIDRPPSGTISDKLILDPNDDFLDGTYEGGQSLTYTKENDNRATLKTGEVIAKTNVNSKLVNDVFTVEFPIMTPFVEKVEFKVSQFAGDNYQLYAFCDKNHLNNLYNTDHADANKIVDVCESSKRLDCIGAVSPILTVWRLLHIERETMKKFPIKDNEQYLRHGLYITKK